jgi:hypothetical protein
MRKVNNWGIGSVVSALIVVGCGGAADQQSSSQTNESQEAGVNETTVEGASSEIEVDEGLLSTEIRLPLDLFTAGIEDNVTPPTEEELRASLKEDGYDIDVTVNDDNTVTYRMSRGEYDRFKKDLKRGVDDSIQETINNEAKIYKSVTYSDDLREFKVTVNRAEFENSFSFFAFSILISAGFYQAFTGIGENDRYVVIEYIDEQTNAVFDTYDSREDESPTP